MSSRSSTMWCRSRRLKASIRQRVDEQRLGAALQADEPRGLRALAGVVGRAAVIDRGDEIVADAIREAVDRPLGAVDGEAAERGIVPLELDGGEPLAVAD